MRRFAFIVIFTIALVASAASGASLNGFDISNASVSQSAILRGGPPRDGIPALFNPNYIKADQADYLYPEERVLGILIDGLPLAYPVKILNYHELVNDDGHGSPFLISYCPLCGTGMAFSSLIKGKPLQFGVSGLLYNSDVLFYDKQSDSLWSQIMSQAITGPMVGEKLQQLPLQHTTWEKWRADHPATKVLSYRQGYSRDYHTNPYGDYEKVTRLYFDVAHKAPGRYHSKEKVLGMRLGNQARAYPFVELGKYGKDTFTDQLGGQRFVVNWDADNNSASITDLQGAAMNSTTAFWFAWYAFHPDTEIFEAASK